MQPVKFLSVDEEDAKHAQFIRTKRDFTKHVNIQSLPVDVAQHIKNGKNIILLLYTYRKHHILTFCSPSVPPRHV